LIDGVNAIRIVRVAGEKAALDTLLVYAAYVGCSVGLYKLPVEVDQKPMTTKCTKLAAVQVGNSLDFVAVRQRSVVALHRLSRTLMGNHHD
jgi:hypothetical protein